MKIACYAAGFGYEYGIQSCVSTEARLPLSYGTLLATKGHEAHIITTIDQPAVRKPKNLQWVKLDTARQIEYDICICCQESLEKIRTIKADTYIIIFYTWENAPKWKVLWENIFNRPVICVEYQDISIEDTYFWPYPIFAPEIKNPNFNKKNTFYVCKHNPNWRDKEQWEPFQRFLLAMRDAALDYNRQALFLIEQYPYLDYFNSSREWNLLYHKLLQRLRNTKLSLSYFYGAQSVIESVISGCVPILWDNPHWKKGGGCLLDCPNITLFDVNDTYEQHLEKFTKLLTDEDYYTGQWNNFYAKVEHHHAKASYSMFLEILDKENVCVKNR